MAPWDAWRGARRKEHRACGGLSSVEAGIPGQWLMESGDSRRDPTSSSCHGDRAARSFGRRSPHRGLGAHRTCTNGVVTWTWRLRQRTVLGWSIPRSRADCPRALRCGGVRFITLPSKFGGSCITRTLQAWKSGVAAMRRPPHHVPSPARPRPSTPRASGLAFTHAVVGYARARQRVRPMGRMGG